MKKRLVKHASMLMLAFALCLLALSPVKTQAASGKTKALKAYKSYLSKVRKQNKKSKFALAYIDRDSVPELYVITKGKGGIYKYSGGKVKRVHDINYSGDDYRDFRAYYYKKTGVFREDYHNSGACSDYEKYFYLKGKLLKNGSRRQRWCIGYDEYYTEGGERSYESSYSYTKNALKGKTVSRKALAKQVKKYTKGKKPTRISLKANTPANVKKKVK